MELTTFDLVLMGIPCAIIVAALVVGLIAATPRWLAVATLMSVPALVFGLPLLIGVWLPDLWASRPKVLAELHLADGRHVRVEQFWSHVDFYTTQVVVTDVDGTERHVGLIDGDDDKEWSASIEFANGSVTASTSDRERTFRL